METKARDGAHWHNINYTSTAIRILSNNSTSKLLCSEVSNPILIKPQSIYSIFHVFISIILQIRE